MQLGVRYTNLCRLSLFGNEVQINELARGKWGLDERHREAWAKRGASARGEILFITWQIIMHVVRTANGAQSEGELVPYPRFMTYQNCFWYENQMFSFSLYRAVELSSPPLKGAAPVFNRIPGPFSPASRA